MFRYLKTPAYESEEVFIQLKLEGGREEERDDGNLRHRHLQTVITKLKII